MMPGSHHDCMYIGPFSLDIFWTITVPLLRQMSWRLQSDDRLLTHLRIVRMPSPVQSTNFVMLTTPLQTGSTVLSGRWDTHNKLLLPSNVWQQFFGKSFLRQQENDLPPAELWCACSFLLIGRYICLLQYSNTTLPSTTLQ
ncbi:hypothetical protein TNCV_4076761 [Trichonephila clavipes]|nr:hypothetical protein TNCV_4076761 [Trichonephila clavipes]